MYPLLVIATSAAVVASQALISGAFSLTQQAIQLGYSPRMRIIHTSKQEAGQIYIPEVNKALAAGTLLLVLGFRSADAPRRGLWRCRERHDGDHEHPVLHGRASPWGWSKLKARSFLVFFLSIDLAFFFANLVKIPHGGWVPLAIAGRSSRS